MVVGGNTICNVEVGRALAEERVVDEAIVKIAELTGENVDVSKVEKARESVVKLAALIERYGVEVAMDWNFELVDGVSITEDAAVTVKSTVVAVVAIIEDDVATVLVETIAAEDDIAVVLAERLSALMMSAAFVGVLDLCFTNEKRISYLFCYTVYDGLQVCSWNYREDPSIDHSQILRPYRVPSQRVCLKVGSRSVDGLRKKRLDTYPKPVGADPRHRPAQLGALPVCHWDGILCVFHC